MTRDTSLGERHKATSTGVSNGAAWALCTCGFVATDLKSRYADSPAAIEAMCSRIERHIESHIRIEAHIKTRPGAGR